jgi:hypothetical protein
MRLYRDPSSGWRCAIVGLALRDGGLAVRDGERRHRTPRTTTQQ